MEHFFKVLLKTETPVLPEKEYLIFFPLGVLKVGKLASFKFGYERIIETLKHHFGTRENLVQPINSPFWAKLKRNQYCISFGSDQGEYYPIIHRL